MTLQQKAHCVTRYNETQSVTSILRRFQTQCRQTPVRSSILRWVENFNSIRNVENRNGTGMLAKNENIQTVRNYFRPRLRRSMRRAESDLAIRQSTIHRILKETTHIFP